MKKRTPQQIFDDAFSRPRDPRSDEYKRGVFNALNYRLGVVQGLNCPYPVGSAQADAWFAGTSEGYALAAEERGRVEAARVAGA